ncbi:hypothetical protein K4A83_14355 [Spirulina subsalsa FACHB-351]|jgi:hypothetical protein|uniref:Uncharacterized protein n=1 Tax=Spirulina subsalsa FACHB-351 TaxID=234711 RepID=A0ABT3L7I0_9CYAN|nr:hypothetical protein [Spirulina subsalsa FACHB-351]
MKAASHNFKDEDHLQKLLLKVIKADQLSELVESTLGEDYDHSKIQFPQFSIDHLSRRACIDAGRRVLRSLEFLEVLTADQNVSLTKNEIMRPDIVCINAEQQCVVMFELKVSSVTGRQSLTELIAYEQELKNTLPFLAEYDVCHVLISPEWSTLMDHSVASSVTWSGRQILCLQAGLEKRKLTLKTRIPEAWKITGAAHFPELAMPCITVCLYDLDAYTAKDTVDSDDKKSKLTDELDNRIWTALSVIAREGDRIGGHGFALLWKDTSSISLTSYNITICGVSPFEFYKMSRERSTILADDGRLVAALDRFIYDSDPDGVSGALLRVAQSADTLLREVSDPRLEGWSNWATERRTLCSRGIPLLCEFWGALGDYSRDYVMNPAVRTHQRNLLLNGTGDWRDPKVGLPLIQSFTKPELFYEGEVRCSDAFRLGVLLGLDRLLRLNIQHADLPRYRARYEWNRIEMMAAIEEVRMLANAASNVERPENGFTFIDDPLADDEEEAARFVNWLTRDFFGRNVTVVRCFFVGFFSGFAFDPSRGLLDPEPSDEMIAQMAESIADCSAEILLTAQILEKEGPLPLLAENAYSEARSALGLKKTFKAVDISRLTTRQLFRAWPKVLYLSDLVVENVFHQHFPLATEGLDWNWFKQGVREAQSRGEVSFGVILLPNGQFVTGRTTPPEMGDFEMHNDDPENKVLFLDRSNGIGLMRVVSWADLENGQAFASVRDH